MSKLRPSYTGIPFTLRVNYIILPLAKIQIVAESQCYGSVLQRLQILVNANLHETALVYSYQRGYNSVFLHLSKLMKDISLMEDIFLNGLSKSICRITYYSLASFPQVDLKLMPLLQDILGFRFRKSGCVAWMRGCRQSK
jgi:hypothetical protein